jgi:hypothetical protein
MLVLAGRLVACNLAEDYAISMLGHLKTRFQFSLHQYILVSCHSLIKCLLSSREVPGTFTFPERDYTDPSFSWFSSFTPGKVKICQVPRHEDVWRSGGINQCATNLGTDGGEWSDARTGHFNPWRKFSVISWMGGWVVPIAGLDTHVSSGNRTSIPLPSSYTEELPRLLSRSR